jgi:DNA-binding CsgD family transcriptional regulator
LVGATMTAEGESVNDAEVRAGPLPGSIVLVREPGERVESGFAGRGSNLGADPLRRAIERAARRTGARIAGVRTDGLSNRECEVLALVAGGRSNGEIGEALFISRKTASVHVANIKAKLGAESRVEIAAFAIRRGMLGMADSPET